MTAGCNRNDGGVPDDSTVIARRPQADAAIHGLLPATAFGLAVRNDGWPRSQ
jgi:hypothetical protein